MNHTTPELSPLGKQSAYISQYDPSLLFPIARILKRGEIDVPAALPFKGMDVWNSYELSWLNSKGKPQVAIGQFIIDSASVNIIESKSFKLYLNSFNSTKISAIDDLKKILEQDISKGVQGEVEVKIIHLDSYSNSLEDLRGRCIDAMDISCDTYQVNPKFLKADKTNQVEETLHSNLLKSNCLVTGQPDWGSVEISYSGPKIDEENLLRYIVSFREHNEFHEQCVERIFMDIMRHCKPNQLTVKAFYTRRGGLDINPIRSTQLVTFDKTRTVRQ